MIALTIAEILHAAGAVYLVLFFTRMYLNARVAP
jgi:hypothetical protein